MRFADALKFLLQLVQLLVRHILQIHQARARAFHATDQFIQLQVDRLHVAVLRVLDQEHHEKRNDGGSGVDDQLPGIRVAKIRTG